MRNIYIASDFHIIFQSCWFQAHSRTTIYHLSWPFLFFITYVHLFHLIVVFYILLLFIELNILFINIFMRTLYILDLQIIIKERAHVIYLKWIVSLWQPPLHSNNMTVSEYQLHRHITYRCIKQDTHATSLHIVNHIIGVGWLVSLCVVFLLV